jgi:hypothetical protein
MKPDARFRGKSHKFWALAKFLSERAGYSDRGTKQLKFHSVDGCRVLLGQFGLRFEERLACDVVEYLNWRSTVLNTYVEPLLMSRDSAEKEFEVVRSRVNPKKPLSMNKQKGEKAHYAYLASMVSMIAEEVVGPNGFVDDARKLSILTDRDELVGIFSRRFDGAFPNTLNPRALWEIKEYYGTTTFGSRVADGVYETLLDGYEIEAARQNMGQRIAHYLFIDDRYTWWECGRSYLCRMIDMLHTAHVDEIFFGREVLSSWAPTLRSLAAPNN